MKLFLHRFNFWSLLWKFSERFDIPLGKYAPYVVHKMIDSSRYERMN